jgi:hypothetical protein
VSTIVIDFSACGATIQLDEAAITCNGFKVQSWTGTVLTLALAYTELWWFKEQIWSITLPGFSATGASSGLGSMTITFLDIIPDALNFSQTLPFLRMTPGAALATPALIAAWNGIGAVRVSPKSTVPVVNNLPLALQPQEGATLELSSAGIFIGLLSGLYPDLPAVSSMKRATECEMTSSIQTWGATRVNDNGMPLWQLKQNTRSSKKMTASLSNAAIGSLSFELGNLVSDLPPGMGYAAVYVCGLPGYPDQAMTMAVQLDSTPTSITSFTADHYSFDNISGPQTVQLSWSVVGATSVTLSGYGVVDTVVTNFQAQVEQTTTFVLTAFDSVLDAITSKQVTVTVTPDLATRLIPKGTILVWSGLASAPPPGWAVCNGSNGTPALQDTFVMGAASDSQVGTSGAADPHTHTIPALTLAGNTSSAGGHSHGMPTAWYARNLTSGDKTGIDTRGTYNSSTQSQSVSGHTHSYTITFPLESSGSATVNPPYYALCYIIKL